MTDVVFGRIFRPAPIKGFKHSALEYRAVDTLGNYIVLMKYMTEEVAIIYLPDDMTIDLVRKHFEPIAVVTPECNIERDDVFHFSAVNCAVADSRASDRKPVQKRFRRLDFGALKEIA